MPWWNRGKESNGSVRRRHEIVRKFLESTIRIGNRETAFYQFKSFLNQYNQFQLDASYLHHTEDEDPDIRLSAAFMLLDSQEKHPKAIATTKAILEDEDLMRRFGAAAMLAPVTALPEELISTLERLYAEENWIIKVVAAAALAGRRTEVIPVLGRALKGDNRALIEQAFRQYRGADFTDNRAVIDEVVSTLTPMLQSLAAAAFGRIGVRSGEAIETIIERIAKGDASSRLANVYLLLSAGDRAKEALPGLTTILENPDEEGNLKQVVASVVGKLGVSVEASKSLVRPLLKAMKSGDWLLASNAVSSLNALGQAPKAAAMAMLRQLTSPDPAARSLAALCLGKFGSPAAGRCAALLDRARSETDRDVWRSLGDAIVMIGVPAFPTLLDAVVRDDLQVMPLVGEALARIGCGFPAELAQATLPHGDGRVRRFASSILALIGPQAAEAVPVATELLRHDDEEIRLDAIIALTAIGRGASDAAPLLVVALLDDDPDISQAAATALQGIGPEARPYLEEALASANAAEEARLVAVLARCGVPAAAMATPARFSYIGDDDLLRYFLIVGTLITEHGPVSRKRIGEEVSQQADRGLVSDKLPINEQTQRSWIARLEKILSTAEGRCVTLIANDGTRPGMLTEDGIKYFMEISNYFKSIY